jgi:hypothetical protein
MGRCRRDSCGSGQGLVAGSWEYDNETSDFLNVGNYLTTCVTLCFSRRILLHGVS